MTIWNQTPCHSSFSGGIICGPHRGSFAVRDHLRSGIICGAVQYFPLRNFRILYYSGMRYCYNTLLSNLRPIFCQVVAYGRLNTKENFKLLALKAIAVAYEKWSVTKGPKYSDLLGKLLVFWKTGRWGEVVATERWWQSEARLAALEPILFDNLSRSVNKSRKISATPSFKNLPNFCGLPKFRQSSKKPKCCLGGLQILAKQTVLLF